MGAGLNLAAGWKGTGADTYDRRRNAEPRIKAKPIYWDKTSFGRMHSCPNREVAVERSPGPLLHWLVMNRGRKERRSTRKLLAVMI